MHKWRAQMEETMWIANAADGKEEQSIININMSKATSADKERQRQSAAVKAAGDTLTISAIGLEFLTTLREGDSSTGIINISNTENADGEKAQEKIEAEKSAEEKRIEQMQEYMKQMEERFQQMRESSKKGADRTAELAKIMEIARRIARGDRVPAKDEKKLMEFDGELYQLSKTAALTAHNKKPKKHKSLFKDEEDSDKRETLRQLERGQDSTIASSPSDGSSSNQTNEQAPNADTGETE